MRILLVVGLLLQLRLLPPNQRANASRILVELWLHGSSITTNATGCMVTGKTKLPFIPFTDNFDGWIPEEQKNQS